MDRHMAIAYIVLAQRRAGGKKRRTALLLNWITEWNVCLYRVSLQNPFVFTKRPKAA